MTDTTTRADGQDSWFAAEEARLIEFPDTFVTATGDAPVLDWTGRPQAVATPTFLTARTAYVTSLATLRGVPGAAAHARALIGRLAELDQDGWPDLPGTTGTPQSLYTLSFVILASSTALMAGIDGAEPVAGRALSVLKDRFWDDAAGRGIDKIHPDGSPTGYRGINANMHLVEALGSAADALDDPTWTDRAVRICDFVIDEAERNHWRINEHYDADWNPVPGFNRTRPGHPFAPYGSTPGHGFEWARLLAQTFTALTDGDRYLEAARNLYDRAVTDGWAPDGLAGFVYTTDWDGSPVWRERLHWIPAEALSAAAILTQLSDALDYPRDVDRWSTHLREHFVDQHAGSWYHYLDADTLSPVHTDRGKPDLYHTYQTMLIPQVPVALSVGRALTQARPSAR